MTSLFSTNTKMAIQAIRTNKMRSVLTMLGIIIGVSSVILTVAMGEGLRRQVVDTNQATNDRLVVIRSGQVAKRDAGGKIIDVNPLASFGLSTLTEQDFESLQKLPEAGAVVPLSTVSGLASNFDNQTFQGTVIATTGQFPALVNQKVTYGSFFDDDTSGRNVAVIGRRVAEGLYNENVPLGKLMSIRGQDFVIGGVFDEFKTNPLSNVADLNKAIFISYNTAKELTGNTPAIYQFMLSPKDNFSTDQLAAAVYRQLLDNHGQQEDFSVLKAQEIEQVARRSVSAATAFVAGIAAISLIVGGIGIMNIMFVSVTERTREIGVRKSLGATNRQIYSQFLVEAAVISIVGGIIGVGIALAAATFIRITTQLQPAVTWQIVALAVGVSAGVGILFGTAPAVKAARKDPIESLRYE